MSVAAVISDIHTANKFPKTLRLLNSQDFQAVFDKVDFKSRDSFFICLARTNGLANSRLGLIIPKKHLKRAVDRNQVKRIIRESFRTQPISQFGLDIIILARSNSIVKLNNKELADNLRSHWSRLIKKSKANV